MVVSGEGIKLHPLAAKSLVNECKAACLQCYQEGCRCPIAGNEYKGTSFGFSLVVVRARLRVDPVLASESFIRVGAHVEKRGRNSHHPWVTNVALCP